MLSNKIRNCYVFVNTLNKELVLDEEDYYSFWETEEDIIQVVKNIHSDKPYFDWSNYGIAYVTYTYTEFEEGRDLQFMNVEVLYKVSEIL